MRRIHLIVGALLFIAFLITGRLMRHDFPDKDVIDQEFRMLMRSRHIYILLASLVHLALGLYFTWMARPLARVFQGIGSVILIGSGILLVWAFFSETYNLQHYSDASRQGLYAALAGVLVHGTAALADRTAPSANASDADIQ